jgi:flavin-dependent dehydrogenase
MDLSELEELGEYDVVVIGLGIAGLTFIYELLNKKQGLKIIGLEKNSESGAYLSGSYGHTRSYFERPNDPEWDY